MEAQKLPAAAKNAKNLSGRQIAKVVSSSGVVFIIVLALAIALGDHSNKAAWSRGQPLTQTPASTGKPTTPTMSVSALRTQETPVLTGATNYLVNLYAKVQSDALQPGTTGVNGALNHDKNTFIATPDNTVHTAYVSASNAYYDANQAQPSALDDWNGDAEQLYTDITEWTTSEDNYLVDQLFGTPSGSDKAAVDAAAQGYTTDLAKAQADISALPN